MNSNWFNLISVAKNRTEDRRRMRTGRRGTRACPTATPAHRRPQKPYRDTLITALASTLYLKMTSTYIILLSISIIHQQFFFYSSFFYIHFYILYYWIRHLFIFEIHDYLIRNWLYLYLYMISTYIILISISIIHQQFFFIQVFFTFIFTSFVIELAINSCLKSTIIWLEID